MPPPLVIALNVTGSLAYLATLLWADRLGRDTDEPHRHLDRFRRAARLSWWAVAAAGAMALWALATGQTIFAIMQAINLGLSITIARSHRYNRDQQHLRVHHARRAEAAQRSYEQSLRETERLLRRIRLNGNTPS